MTNKFELFEEYSNDYINLLIEFIDYSKNNKIIPFTYSVFADTIKKKIKNEKLLMIQNGLDYVLPHKENLLSVLDTDIEKQLKNNHTLKTLELEMNKYDASISIIYEILENAQNANNKVKKKINEYLEITIIILESIRNTL